MEVSTSEQLILGMLAEGEKHAYEIEKLIAARGMRKWTDVAFSSIYYLLEKLESKGLAASSPSEGKKKRPYRITDAGLRELHKSACERLSERYPANTHLMTGIAISDALTATEYVAALEIRSQVLKDDLDALRAVSASRDSVPLPARRLLALSERLVEAELAWVSDEIESEKK